MKDFFKVFLLLCGAILFYVGLLLLGNINPFALSIIGIILAVLLIGVGGWILRRRFPHKLPREKRKKYLEDYKKQSKNDD